MVQNPLSDQHPAVTVGVGADTSGFTGAIDNAIQKMGAFKGAVTVAGGALAALGAGAMVQATRQAMELESAFAEVSTLMDENANAAAVFGDDVERLSTEFAAQGGQVEVINGLYQTLSAGITDTTKATALMETAMKSATAGLSDTETAVDILTTVVNAYGLEAQEASRISDVLFETVRQGKTRYDELASTIGRIVPISSELGISFETVGAAAATLTAQGQSTDEAVTAIRQAMVQLLRPQKDLLSLINDLGFETGRALVESEGFAGALRLLNEEAEESNVELGTAFGRVRAMQAVLPLAGAAADDFRENLRLMEEAAGATDTAFQKMSDTAQFRFRQAMNELESSLSETGDQFLPFATKAADAIGTLISDFNDLNQASDGAVGAIGSVGLALGGLALVAGGPIALAIAGVGALATAYATDFGDIRSTVQRSMNDVAAIMDRTLLAMTDQTDSELGKQEAIWDGWADTVVDASGRALADGVDTFATVSVNALDLVLTELINVGDAISMVARVGRAVQQSDPERAENILDQSIERIRERHRSVIERGRERSEAHNERQRQRDLLATTNDPRIRGTDIGFQNLAGSTPLQRAQEANNAQATGASGSAAATTASLPRARL